MPDPSKPVPLEAEAIEIAVQRFYQQPSIDDENSAQQQMEYAILAFLDAMGVTVERRPGSQYYGYEKPPLYRLVSHWFPIKGPVDE